MPTPQTTLTKLDLVTPVVPDNTGTISIDSTVLPVTILADLNTTRVELSIYNTTNALDVYTTVNGQHQFTSSVAIDQTIAETAVQIIGRNYDPTATWTATTVYPIGYRYADPNGNVQVVVKSGTATTLASGTLGSSGVLQPVWKTNIPATVTNISLANNTLVVTCNNTLLPGQQVFFANLVSATFLNGQIVTVVTATSTQFTATYQHADYASTADTGTADACTIDNGITWANYGFISITPTKKFNLIAYQSGLALAIAPPSGIVAKKNQNICTLEWVTPDYPGFIGVRVMISTDEAGINPPYVQFGDLVTNVNRTTQTVIDTISNTAVNVPSSLITAVSVTNNELTVQSINSFVQGTVLTLAGLAQATFLNEEVVTVDSSDGLSFTARVTHADYPLTPDTGTATSTISTNIVTSTQTVQDTNYSSVDIPSSLINQDTFYALFSTVIQDPGTNVLYESVQNGPLLSGFVNLKVVSPTDFPVLQRKEDIAGRLIGQITKQRPTLDLSPRSEIRDIFIDPFSIEVANMSVREWFSRVSTSISGISQVDDTTGTGVSDPFQSSPYKQQIARAYGLSPQDTQNLIDEQFDILGEQAGLTRLAATQSTVVLTFYTYQQPQQSITVPQGAVVATVSDSTTPALTFVTQGQATINVSNLASFYNPQYGWWGVSVPAQCTTSGSNGNVGAGTIRQTVSNTPSGLNVTNLVPAQFGTDDESNSSFAARIQARTVTGVDTGTRHGYLVTALSTPGIIGAEVVAAGDLEMVRDWDAIRQKHVFGTVDIYARGTTTSQQDEIAYFQYQTAGTPGSTTTYLTTNYVSGLQFNIPNFSNLTYGLYQGVELQVSSGGTPLFYFGLERAQFDNTTGNLTLNAADMAYTYVGSTISKAKVAYTINSVPATNQAAVSAISPSIGSYTVRLCARYESPFTLTPTLQPVLTVFSVTGSANQTGVIPTNSIELIHTSDFLLNGGSNEAGDFVRVNLDSTTVTTTITASSSPVEIDTGMDVPLNSNGTPIDVVSVRNLDGSILYKVGQDYKIVATGPYRTYGLQTLSSNAVITNVSITSNVATITADNKFEPGAMVTFSGLIHATALNGQTIAVASATSTSFTVAITTPDVASTPETGFAAGYAIQNGDQIVVGYNKFVLYERLTLVQNETQVLNGTLPTSLNNDGFIQNVWLPESYSQGIWQYPNTDPYLTLVLDGWDGLYGSDGGLDLNGSTGLVGAKVPHDSRYIKVTYYNGVTDVVKREGIDYTLKVDPTSGAATISRILTGTIPDGGTVKVSYWYLEPFVFSTQYPAFVQVLANQLATTKHAAADMLVKAMVANPIDITLSVTLTANTAPEAVDLTIRTVINIVLDNARGTLYQSELIRQVQAITGVQSVQVPLIKCAKSDASYDIGVVIPTGTTWNTIKGDPAFAAFNNPPLNSWITSAPVLPDSTIPSGGDPDAVVNFLYEGQVFRRAMSVSDFMTKSTTPTRLAQEGTPGSFYIIGTNDSGIDAAYQAAYAQKIMLVVPQDVPNPGNLNYLCTYQVFNEGGAKDVTVSATEYLAPGRITINYITG